MEVKIKTNNEMIDATIEMVDGVMVVSPKEVKFEPEDGDVVTYLTYNKPTIYVYKGGYKYNTSYYVAYSSLRNMIFLTSTGFLDGNRDDIRPATEEEKKLLFDKIDQEGYEWFADKRELVKKKWKPKNGDFFYFPLFLEGFDKFKVESKAFICGSLSSFDKGWHFKTEEECQNFCDKLNKAINPIKP